MRESTRASVLVVEDDLHVRLSLNDLLEEAGFAVTAVANGAEALVQLAQAEPPDVIVLDLAMPVLDGWQFLKVRSESEEFARVPVIAVSAVSYRGAPGAEAVLPKPINSDALIGLIRQVRSRVA